jgi:uncharacterized protein YndB with AHSA1/START domain
VPLLQIDESINVSLTWRIEAPRARVWQCITDADLLRQWLGELVSWHFPDEPDPKSPLNSMGRTVSPTSS